MNRSWVKYCEVSLLSIVREQNGGTAFWLVKEEDGLYEPSNADFCCGEVYIATSKIN